MSKESDGQQFSTHQSTIVVSVVTERKVRYFPLTENEIIQLTMLNDQALRYTTEGTFSLTLMLAIIIDVFSRSWNAHWADRSSRFVSLFARAGSRNHYN